MACYLVPLSRLAHNMGRFFRTFAVLVAFFGLLAISLRLPSEFALAQTFNPTSGTQSWNTNSNWTPASFPNAIGATANFNSPTAAQTVNLATSITAGTISITNNSSNVLTLANGMGGSLNMNQDNTGPETAAITISGTSTTTNNVTVSASVTMADALRVTVNQTGVTGAGAATFTGTLIGHGNFIKTGPGRLSFTTNSKTYTGTTTIEAGRLRMTNSGSTTGTSSITVQNTGMLFLDDNANWSLGSGTITINGDGTGETNQGIGALRMQAGGASTINNDLILGSNSTIHIDGNSANTTFNGSVSGNFQLTKSGGGRITLNGVNAGYAGSTRILNGGIVVTSTSQLGTGALEFAQASSNSTTVTLNNPTQSIGNLSTVWSNTTGTLTQSLVLNGTALTIHQTTDATFGNGNVASLAGVISGNGGRLIKTGNATLTLTGANTYTGGTTVSQGTLIVNNTIGSGTGSGNLTVGSGATLGGGGTIGGNTTFQSNSIHSPGNSPGIQTFNNSNVTYDAGSTLIWELIGNTTTQAGPPWNFDQVIGTAASTLSISDSANSQLVFNSSGDVNWFDSFWSSNRSWLVFSGFNSLTFGKGFKVGSVSADSAGNSFGSGNTAVGGFFWSRLGNDVYLNYNPVAVPEPASLGGALMLFAAYLAQRTKRSRKIPTTNRFLTNF